MSTSVYSSASSDDDEVVVHSRTSSAVPTTTLGAAEDQYRFKNQSLKYLVVLCRGLKDEDGNELLDIKTEPWSKLKTALVKPCNADYVEEIVRRHQEKKKTDPSLASSAPQPKGWTEKKLLAWLDLHPIELPSDIAYLTGIVANRKGLVRNYIEQQPDSGTGESRNWKGKFPFLRLIHCLVDNDEIKYAFLHRNDVDSSRLTLDNRNSVTKRAATVWEMLSEKFNDDTFTPESEAVQDLHSDYKDSIVLYHSLVKNMTVATPEKCKEKISSAMIAMKRCIAKWERSGQGEGGNIEEEEEEEEEGDDEEQDSPSSKNSPAKFGSLNRRSKIALDSRESFFNSHQSYLLYLWHMLDKHNLLSTSLNRLETTVSATDGGVGVPSVIGARAPLEMDNDSWETNTTKTERSRMQNIVDLTGLTDSIKTLGEKAASVAAVQVQELRKNREHDSLEKKRDRFHSHKQSVVSQKLKIGDRIAKLKAEKRKLQQDFFVHRQSDVPQTKKRETSDFFEEQIQQVDEEIAQGDKELLSLLETPTRNNRTPDSAI
jgi:ElaB/YqjD/DUF883 family membrane-anchored ribosome-binding protein